MTPLTVGIIGIGGAGRAHATRFARHPQVKSVIAYDTRDDLEVSVPLRADFQAFLKEVDAVSICTPDDTHCRYIIDCLEAGVHVLVEKPMVTSSAEAREVASALAQHPDQIFAVHHQMRCVDAFRQTRELVRNGTLGPLSHIEANYWHDMRDRWTRFDNWRAEGRGQSVVFGGACHPLDLVLDLVGEPVERHETFVNKNTFDEWRGSYTAATTMLQFASGITAKVHASFAAVFPQRNDLIVLGERGTVVDGVHFDGDHFHDTNTHRATWKGVRLRRGRAFKEFALNPIAAITSKLASRTPMFRNHPYSVYHHEHACRVLINNFVDSIAGAAEVLVGFEDGRRVVELCNAIERSIAHQHVDTHTLPLFRAA